MKIDYYYINPTNNITLLVTSDIHPNLMPIVAAELLKLESKAEQVGYVNMQGETVNLHMAGGEFCGNATMSAAALTHYLIGTDIDGKAEYSVGVYGTVNNIKTVISRISETNFDCDVYMPNKYSVCTKKLEYNDVALELPVVYLDGITHIIALDNVLDESIEEDAIKKWSKDLKVDCIGIINYNKTTKFLKPLVYVPKLDSLYWESSCASGTTAVAVYLHQVASHNNFEFLEPGGKLCVKIHDNGDIILNGRACIEKYNTVDIHV